MREDRLRACWRGPTFHLSDNDRAALTAQLGQDKEDMRLEGLVVVEAGSSHTRSDILYQHPIWMPQRFLCGAVAKSPWCAHPGRTRNHARGILRAQADGSVKGET